MAKPTAEEAKRLLANTAPEKAFWVNNGPVLKNTIELAGAAKKLTPEQFTHHANSQKNDFATWVQEAIGDSDLAQRLRKMKTKEGFASVVAGRLRELQKALK
ncbi:hypothetical protein HYU17_05935 [Candidatus Woesearchaeota archaeon]|nr:hypothetical protein [Candidatus Woesearchaeota archaeon]